MTVTVVGKVVKLEENKWGFWQMNLIDADEKWHNNIGLGTKQAPQSFGKGDWVEVTYDPDNFSNVVDRQCKKVDAPEGASKGGKPSGGGFQKGGKKPFVDNSVGMGIGAALNNAVQLLIGGKIKENEIPTVISNLYLMSEEAKKAATDGSLEDFVANTQFSLTGSNEAPAKAKQTAKKAPAKKAPKQAEPEEEEDNDPPF